MDHIAENCHNWTPNKDSDRPLTIGAKSYGEMHAKTRYLKQATSVQTLGPVQSAGHTVSCHVVSDVASAEAQVD